MPLPMESPHMKVFDTLEFARRLQQAGVAREHAETHAELLSEMILTDLATKDDVERLGTQLRYEIAASAATLRQEMAKQTAELHVALERQTFKVGGFILMGMAVFGGVLKLM